MTTVLTTSFAAVDGSAWPAPWTTPSGVSSVQAGRGQQATPATAWTDCSSYANVSLANGRVDVTARFPVAAGRSLRLDVRFNPTTGNGYRVIMPGDYAGFQLIKVTNWAETELFVDWTVTWLANTDYRIAFEFQGSSLRAKRWIVSSQEPATWTLSATDATHTAGDVRLVTVTSTADSATSLWDDVVIDDGVVAPVVISPPPVVGSRSASRLGIHNDAFLAPSSDYGTYTTFTTMTVAESRAYLAAQIATGLPMGGESAVANVPASLFANAEPELKLFGWSFLNPLYHPDVLASWTQSEKDEAAKKLGYRLRLISATLSSIVVAGAVGSATLTFINDGYAAPYRDHPVKLVLVGAKTYVFDVPIKTKSLVPGVELSVTALFSVVDAGSYSMHLVITDPSASLANNPAYHIQLANAGVWDAATGRNSLLSSVSVTASSTSSPGLGKQPLGISPLGGIS